MSDKKLRQNMEVFIKLIKFHDSAKPFKEKILKVIFSLSQDQFKTLIFNWSGSYEVNTTFIYNVISMTLGYNVIPRTNYGVTFLTCDKQMWLDTELFAEVSLDVISSLISTPFSLSEYHCLNEPILHYGDPD